MGPNNASRQITPINPAKRGGNAKGKSSLDEPDPLRITVVVVVVRSPPKRTPQWGQRSPTWIESGIALSQWPHVFETKVLIP